MRHGWMYAKDGAMKADRLYGITLYLLNHKRASGSCLAERFEVSLRCIQRDMDTLSMAGVPIVAYSGVNGGYELQEGFKLPAAMVKDEDHAIIAASLESMERAGLKREVQSAKLLFPQREETALGIHMDFSIADETAVQERMILRKIIAARHAVSFLYTDAKGTQSERIGEAVALIYRWYAWYLVGWDVDKRDYRMYKLVRMEKIQELPQQVQQHPALSVILKQMDKADEQVYWTIKLHCQPESRGRMKEYFQGMIEEDYPDTSFLYSMRVPQQEHFWYANLLGMKDTVRILEPQELIERIRQDCQDILKLYSK